MKYTLNIFINLLFLIFISRSFAEQFKSPRVFIFHINGVNALPEDAYDNQQSLIRMLGVKSNMVDWDVLYNPTTGNLAKDVMDALKQKRQEGKELSIDDYVMTYMKSYKLMP